MDKVRKKFTASKNWVKAHRTGIAVTGWTVAIAAIALQQYNLKAYYKFLEGKGINPMEFYCPEMFEELLKK
jgi:hypothetical protein